MSPRSHLHQDWARPFHICTEAVIPAMQLTRTLHSRFPAHYRIPTCVATSARLLGYATRSDAVAEPSPSADVAGVSPVPVQMWQG